MKIKVLWFLFLVLALVWPIFSIQAQSFYVKPKLTDNSYAIVQDSHYVVVPSQPIMKLMVFIGGSGSRTALYSTISQFAATQGYHVCNVSYPNGVSTTSFAGSSDSLALNKFRQEICFGTNTSPTVSVDTLNSINTRVIKLLRYLSITYPSQHWSGYLVNSSTPNWSKITIAGHSQGAGHALYLGKWFTMYRILMFSGPNDYSDFYGRSANWLGLGSATPVNSQYAFLCSKDEVVPFAKQMANMRKAGIYPSQDSSMVDKKTTPFNQARILVTNLFSNQSTSYHNSTTQLSVLNTAIWAYMLTPAVSTKENEASPLPEKQLSIYPNPLTDQLFITNTSEKPVEIIIRNQLGTEFFNANIPAFENKRIETTLWTPGFYFVQGVSKPVKIVKIASP